MISPEAQALLERRYLQNGEDWTKLVTRVVNHVCEGEANDYRLDVFNQIHNLVWLPNSPCLVGAGTKNGGLMACFVVGPGEDTLENHYGTLPHIAEVGKRGGGCGFSGSFIRPKDWEVSGSPHGKAYGPNEWAKVVSHALHTITQGNFRSMALMYSISTDNLWEDTDGKDWKKKKTHEFRTDLDEFIDLKHNNGEGKLYNFNQSVFASDSWMQEAIDNPFSEPARQLAKIANNAWKNGEPGLLFADTINNNTPYAECGCKIYTTNPCGEQPLPPFGSCNLGSINISHDTFYDDGIFNYDKLDKVARDMTRFLDNIGDKNKFPNKKFKKWYRKHRPIGIGIMGFADALMRQQIRYGGTESLHFADRVMLAIKNASYNASMKLADERGLPSHAGKTNRRNITTVSIAPTGSIAFLAGCSHGIEPVFAPVYKRTDEHGNEYLFKHPLRNEPYFMSSINDSLEKMPTWSEHIAIQAAVQRHTDSAVSKTINMVNGVQPKDVLDAIIDAWRNGVKGVTIYRTGSRDKEVLEELKEEDSLIIDCPTGVCDL